jgi:hypothetical protein
MAVATDKDQAKKLLDRAGQLLAAAAATAREKEE